MSGARATRAKASGDRDQGADPGADRGGDEELAVFWMPSALPDQNGPAASATEVKERPLSATLTVEATTSMNASATDQRKAPTPASVSITTTPEKATQRRTRTRLPTRSLRWPTQIRPKAPTNWDTAIAATTHGVMEHPTKSGYWGEHLIGARRVG